MNNHHYVFEYVNVLRSLFQPAIHINETWYDDDDDNNDAISLIMNKKQEADGQSHTLIQV